MFSTILLVILLLANTLCESILEWPYQENSRMGRCSTPLATTIDEFGARLTLLLDEESNHFLSPFSIFSVLAMVYQGVGGKVSSELDDVLHLEDNGFDQSTLKVDYRSYVNAIDAGKDKYNISVTNGVFLKPNSEEDNLYTKDIRYYYHGFVEREHVEIDGNVVLDHIDGYMSKNFGNFVKTVFKRPTNLKANLMLVSTLYFENIWKYQFLKNETSDGIFHMEDGETKTVKFMKVFNVELRYFEDQAKGYQFLEIPYKHDVVSIIIALPFSVFQNLNLDMTSKFLCSLDERLAKENVETVVIPKFKLNYETELVDNLRELGLGHIFTNTANDYGTIDSHTISESSIVQKVVIEVSEEGGVPAATTNIPSIDSDSITFIADRPFLFSIIDNKNKLVFFSGRVTDF